LWSESQAGPELHYREIWKPLTPPAVKGDPRARGRTAPRIKPYKPKRLKEETALLQGADTSADLDYAMENPAASVEREYVGHHRNATDRVKHRGGHEANCGNARAEWLRGVRARHKGRDREAKDCQRQS
jgi:hypothetical protein